MASRLARFDHDAIARTKAYVDQVTLPDNSERARPAVERFSRAISAPCAAGAVGPAPGARPQHRRRVRAVPRKAPSRVASRRLNSGSEPETRQILRAAILGIEDHTGAVRVGARIMAHLEFSKEITALLVIDPYNAFISAGPPSIDNRTARIRTEKGRCRH